MTSPRFSLTVAAALAAAVLGIAGASADDTPDLVGTWKLVGDNYASVRIGAANDYHPVYSTPSLGKPAEAWTIVIAGQEGRAFHGVARSPKGGEDAIVGVVSLDGDHLLIAGSEAGMHAEVMDDGQIEFCYIDHEADRAGVACFLGAKE